MNGLFITVQGVIGTDPVRSAWNGQPVLAFRMVNNERRFDSATRGWVDVHSSWLWVNCYGDLARNADESLHKGDRIIVHGKMRVKDYVGSNGEGRTGVDLVADALGPDLKFATARVQVPRRQEDVEEQLRRHVEQLHRDLDEVPRLSTAELVAQRAARPDDGDEEHDELDDLDELEEVDDDLTDDDDQADDDEADDDEPADGDDGDDGDDDGEEAGVSGGRAAVLTGAARR